VPLIDTILAEYPDKVEAFKDGKTGLMGFFVGQVMRATDGKAKPQLVKALVQEKLG
jgi:glutaminyl-tRNA synthetase